MSTKRGLRLVLATAAVTLGLGLMTTGGAGAASSWTDFGSGTGIHQVTYNGGFTSYMSRTGSGIVNQWVAPSGGDHGAYYLYKPLSNGSTVTTPFKQSCDSQGLVGTAFPRVWTYTAASYTPSGVLADYFPFEGLSYWVCEYDLSDWATGSLYYFVGSTVERHVTFSVQESAPGFPASGTMSYSDGTTSYSIDVTAVYVNGTTVTFSGPYPTGSTTQWLVLQATDVLGTLSWGGDAVTTDPSATLASFVPTTNGTDVHGSMTIYTR